jgi:hypothetical protein
MIVEYGEYGGNNEDVEHGGQGGNSEDMEENLYVLRVSSMTSVLQKNQLNNELHH